MDKADIQQLLVKYITNQAGEAEINEVKNWINRHPENELYFIELYEAWQTSLEVNSSVIDEEQAYKLFEAKIKPEKKAINYKWQKLALLLVLAVSLTVIAIHIDRGRSTTPVVVAAKNGSIRKIVLNDGTIVWLNAGSRINYNADFGKTNRIVFLEGEALFDIGHKNRSYPFLVKTANYTIKDVGTRFNLKAYPDDPFFETTVINGEVSVLDNADNDKEDKNWISVKPEQALKIFYHQEKTGQNQGNTGAGDQPQFKEVQIIQVDSSKMNVYDGWKDDHLAFDGARLVDITKILERRYNVHIAIKGFDLAGIKYSGNFNHVASASRALDIIKQNTPLNYLVEGNNIIIYNMNNKPQMPMTKN